MTNFVSGIAPRNATQAALANGAQLSGSPAVLYGLTVNNTKASAQYVQVFDSATVPADGVAPLLCLTVGASVDRTIEFGVYGMNFVNGIYVCNSSTAPTKTIGSADCQFFARVQNA